MSELLSQKKALSLLNASLVTLVNSGAAQSEVESKVAEISAQESTIASTMLYIKDMNTAKQSAQTILNQSSGVTQTSPQPLVTATEKTQHQSVQGPNTVFSGGVVASDLTSIGLARLTKLSEYVHNLGTLGGTSITLDFNNKGVYYLTPFSASSISCALTNVPTAVTNTTYNFSLIINTSTHKTYVGSLLVNGSPVTLVYNGGSANVSVSSATTVFQTLTLVFLNNPTPSLCVTSVSDCY